MGPHQTKRLLRDWLSLQEAADACGMASRTMLAKVRRGKVPAENA